MSVDLEYLYDHRSEPEVRAVPADEKAWAKHCPKPSGWDETKGAS